MRLDPSEVIAGIPILEVRRLFRGLNAGMRLKDVAERIGFDVLATGNPDYETVFQSQVLATGAEAVREAARTHLDSATAKSFYELLSRSERPLLYVGGGVLASNAAKELKELAELMQLPVVTTLMGKGAFPEDHHLFLGMPGNPMFGMQGSEPQVFILELQRDFEHRQCRLADRRLGPEHGLPRGEGELVAGQCDAVLAPDRFLGQDPLAQDLQIALQKADEQQREELQRMLKMSGALASARQTALEVAAERHRVEAAVLVAVLRRSSPAPGWFSRTRRRILYFPAPRVKPVS